MDKKIEQIYLKSEKNSENQKWENSNVDKIVSNDFEQRVKSNNKDYFLTIVEDDDINSKIILKFLDLIKERIPDMDIGMMNYNLNETPLIKT